MTAAAPSAATPPRAPTLWRQARRRRRGDGRRWRACGWRGAHCRDRRRRAGKESPVACDASLASLSLVCFVFSCLCSFLCYCVCVLGPQCIRRAQFELVRPPRAVNGPSSTPGRVAAWSLPSPTTVTAILLFLVCTRCAHGCIVTPTLCSRMYSHTPALTTLRPLPLVKKRIFILFLQLPSGQRREAMPHAEWQRRGCACHAPPHHPHDADARHQRHPQARPPSTPLLPLPLPPPPPGRRRRQRRRSGSRRAPERPPPPAPSAPHTSPPRRQPPRP